MTRDPPGDYAVSAAIGAVVLVLATIIAMALVDPGRPCPVGELLGYRAVDGVPICSIRAPVSTAQNPW